GQYLTLKHVINGEEVRRSYSLCSSPIDKEWKIGVKKIEGGRFSTFVNDVLKVGDELEVMKPDGSFYVDIDPSKKRNYAAFAAGSGITPTYSIIKTHLNTEPDSTFKLFFINQTTASIILKEELEALKNQFMNRFEIFYFLTKERRSVPLFNGRIDDEKLDVLFDTVCKPDAIDHYFICGPEAMIHLLDGRLRKCGIEKNQIHFELFGTNAEATKDEQNELAASLKDKHCKVTIIEGGIGFDFEMEQGSNNVLDEALMNSADLPFACKGGVCATCKAKVVEGDVKMLLSYGLEEDEKEQGYILTCQSIPTSDKLVVDFDI
ncbi:UNVERIFIED_CONTAM: hypothetical protein GTU68_019951, partial [Idotea baltica]|nr:hypothetical protein [Idotea baltica]